MRNLSSLNVNQRCLKLGFLSAALFLLGCANSSVDKPTLEIVGTHEPFAAHAVYFLMTDRFVDGDPANNYEQQGKPGADTFTFDRPLPGPNGKSANVGYLGGDFKGIEKHADYIKDLGFDAIWLTPIVDNPDETFTGGTKVEYGGAGDQGKSGFHGYWASNFFKLDEHLPSKNFDFEALNKSLKKKGLKTVLDIVANHGSPAFTMPKIQPMFGQLYDEHDTLVADHQNLLPKDLDSNNPLHQFYLQEQDLAELSDLNYNNPAMIDYIVNAHLKWISQGADALRIDTIRHMPHSFWKTFTDRIRAQHPDIFMFGESWSYDAAFLAEHTRPENGGVSVLDFPGRKTMVEVFENKDSSFETLLSSLHLNDGMYQNPYELMTHYDSHDVKRLGADTAGYINATNWLFTSRGIPVIYYGSEIAFESDTKEHEGNRNYYGEKNIAKAKGHPIAQSMRRIANIRRDNVALQKGIQVNLTFEKNTAAFLRIYQHKGVNQTALVLLNKSDAIQKIKIDTMLSNGNWKNAISGERKTLNKDTKFNDSVEANGVAVWLFNGATNNAALLEKITKQILLNVP